MLRDCNKSSATPNWLGLQNGPPDPVYAGRENGSSHGRNVDQLPTSDGVSLLSIESDQPEIWKTRHKRAEIVRGYGFQSTVETADTARFGHGVP